MCLISPPKKKKKKKKVKRLEAQVTPSNIFNKNIYDLNSPYCN